MLQFVGSWISYDSEVNNITTIRIPEILTWAIKGVLNSLHFSRRQCSVKFISVNIFDSSLLTWISQFFDVLRNVSFFYFELPRNGRFYEKYRWILLHFEIKRGIDKIILN